MFKFHSLNGYLICHSGGTIAWESNCQTVLSSCEADIVTTNELAAAFIGIYQHAADLGMAKVADMTTIFNDKQAWVD